MPPDATPVPVPSDDALPPMGDDVLRFVLAAGLAMLVPLPWLDAWLEHRFLRKAVRAHAAARGVTLPPDALATLTEDRSGLLAGCVGVALVWPLKKLFRTVLYFFTLKDVVDGVARNALRVCMVDLAVRSGRLPVDADAVRATMDAVLARHEASPVARVLLRHDTPPLHAPSARDPLERTVHTLVRLAGGGRVLPAFAARIRETA